MTLILSPNMHTGRLGLIRVIVIHTIESGETGSVAEAVGNYFARTSTQASAHIGVDTDSTVRYVLDANTAWSAPGANADGLHLELAGRAGQTTGQWTDAASKAILERGAQVVATWCKTHNIPPVHLTDGQLGGGRTRGVVGHNQVSAVFKRSTHWDPGPNFPWATFLARVETIIGSPPQRPPTPAPPKPAPAPPKPTGGLIVNTLDLSRVTAASTTWVRSRGVVPLQRLLSVKADGLGGPGTRAALHAFQSQKGLKADAVFGPVTATAMLAGR